MLIIITFNYFYLCWQLFYYFTDISIFNRELFHKVSAKKIEQTNCTEDLRYTCMCANCSSFSDLWVRMCMFIYMAMILMSWPSIQTCHGCRHWTKTIYRKQSMWVSWHITYLYFLKSYYLITFIKFSIHIASSDLMIFLFT